MAQVVCFGVGFALAGWLAWELAFASIWIV
jgi:hypothetical protein